MPRIVNNGNLTKGENRQNSYFTDEQVADFRKKIAAKQTTVRKITDAFKCSKVTVILMLLGRTYKHVPGALKTVATHPSGRGRIMSTTDKFLAFHTVKIMKLSYRKASLLLKTHPGNLPRRVKAYDPRDYAKHRDRFVKMCRAQKRYARLIELKMHMDKALKK